MANEDTYWLLCGRASDRNALALDGSNPFTTYEELAGRDCGSEWGHRYDHLEVGPKSEPPSSPKKSRSTVNPNPNPQN